MYLFSLRFFFCFVPYRSKWCHFTRIKLIKMRQIQILINRNFEIKRNSTLNVKQSPRTQIGVKAGASLAKGQTSNLAHPRVEITSILKIPRTSLFYSPGMIQKWTRPQTFDFSSVRSHRNASEGVGRRRDRDLIKKRGRAYMRDARAQESYKPSLCKFRSFLRRLDRVVPIFTKKRKLEANNNFQKQKSGKF